MIDELVVKSFESPDETMMLTNAKGECVQIGEHKFWLATAEPGWKFSRDNGPDLGTELCPSPHRLYMLAGRMTVELEDGTRNTLEEGDVALLPPGHDAWVEGDEQVVWFEEELDT